MSGIHFSSGVFRTAFILQTSPPAVTKEGKVTSIAMGPCLQQLTMEDGTIKGLWIAPTMSR